MSKKHNRGIYSSNKNQKYKDLSQDIQTLTVSYTFLMSTLIIFLLSLESFRLELFGNSVSLAIFFMPFVYFLVDVILKEIGLKPAIKAIVTSIFVLFLIQAQTLRLAVWQVLCRITQAFRAVHTRSFCRSIIPI